MRLFYLLFMFIYLPIGIYFYFYFKRIIECITNKKINKYIKVLLIIICASIVYFCRNPFKVGVVIFTHLFIYSLITDLIMYIIKKFKNKKEYYIYKIGIIPIIMTIITLCFAYYSINNIVPKNYAVYSSKISNNYKALFLSDLHYPTTMKKEKLDIIVKELSEINADFIIIGGDITDENSKKQDIIDVYNSLGKIKSKYGIFFVYGNHDKSKYYNNSKFTDEELNNLIIDSGIKPLIDEYYVINDEITLIGRDDSNYGFKGNKRLESKELINKVDDNNYLILIDHHPSDVTINSSLGYDLQLSGHTHGGQLFPTGLIEELFNDDSINYGHKIINDYEIIVTSGIGGWEYPFRTGHHSEYLIIDILKK